MSQPTADHDSPASESAEHGNRLHRVRRRELIYVGAGVVTGFIVLPLLIFLVGTILLGPYAGGKTLGAFFAEFYANLGHGVTRTWFIVLAPYLAIWLVRLSFRPYSIRKEGANAAPPPATQRPEAPGAESKRPGARREPFISS